MHDRLCPGGWNQYDGRCYLLVRVGATWPDAEAYCNSKGGHLASIHSLAENNFIVGLAPNDNYWLGASDSAKEVGTGKRT